MFASNLDSQGWVSFSVIQAAECSSDHKRGTGQKIKWKATQDPRSKIASPPRRLQEVKESLAVKLEPSRLRFLPPDHIVPVVIINMIHL